MQLFKNLAINNIILNEYPFGRELSMQAYIIENEKILVLDNDPKSSFSDVQILEAELHLVDGRTSQQTNGRIDILAQYSGEYLAVVELKIGQLNNEHLGQLKDYLNEKDQLEKIVRKPIGDVIDNNNKLNYIGVLVGTSIAPKLAEDIRNGYSIKVNENEIPIAALVLQRYRGADNAVYVTSETYFKQASKNYSKYIFNEEVYGKGKLVLAVIKEYVSLHNNISFKELKETFPDRLLTGNDKENGKKIFETLSRAEQLANNTGYKRYFTNQSDVIKTSDADVVVSNQWGIGNIEWFIKHINQTIEGFKIKPNINYP